jgi:hypothetical protein
LTLWAAGSPKGEGEQLALEAVEELERLKQRVAELAYSKEQLELRVLDLIMTRAKNAMVTLTGAEREAIEVAAEAYSEDCGDRFAATLRGLLERLN